MNTISFADLKDKVCVITGGAGVIGSSIIEGLAFVGIRTAILDINLEKAEQIADDTRKRFNVQTIAFEADVLSTESLDKARNLIHQKLGNINILIKDISGFDWVFDLNFKGTLLPTIVFARDMIESGKGVILNISSMTSLRPLTKVPAYSAAKASINNFTQWLAVHLAMMNIRVNAIAPGFFLTKQNRFLLVDEKTGKPTPRGEKIIANTPMRRYGTTDELQGTVLYLLSDISKFVTGVIIPVDGGYSAYGGV